MPIRRTSPVGKLLRALEAEGVSVRLGGAGHYRLTFPNGAVCIVPSTPSDERRGYKNVLADVRRAQGRK